MKIREIIHAQNALNILSNSKINMLTAFKLSKFQIELKVESDRFQKVRQDKLNEFTLSGKVDQNGVLIFDPKSSPEENELLEKNFKLFLVEVESVLDNESDFQPALDPISITELVKSDGSQIDIEASVLSYIPWVIGD
jgi:hypothetical protein